MKTFEEWLRENRQTEMPDGLIPESWFDEHNLPMIVQCKCCMMTMALPNAFIDDEGYTYCSDCGGANGNEN